MIKKYTLEDNDRIINMTSIDNKKDELLFLVEGSIDLIPLSEISNKEKIPYTRGFKEVFHHFLKMYSGQEEFAERLKAAKELVDSFDDAARLYLEVI